jgi:hypothetical protein
MRVPSSYDDAKFFIEEVVDERFHQGIHQAFIKWWFLCSQEYAGTCCFGS